MMRTVASIALVGMLSSPAMAQEGETPADPNDILGGWTFKTSEYNGAGLCRMNGTMRLTPNPEPGIYDCELTAVEECSTIDEPSVVVQSCTVRRFGNQVSVRSNIEQFLQSHNDGITYWPDNFALTIQSREAMFGSLISAVTAPVKFRREEGAVS